MHRQLRARAAAASVLFDATQVGDRVWASFLKDADAELIGASYGDRCVSMRQIGGGILAEIHTGALAADIADHSVFEGKNTLLAFRTDEPAGAVRDWLQFHVESAGAEAALIFDRASQKNSAALGEVLSDLDIPVMIVQSNVPLGRPDHPPVSDPALAPGAPNRVRAGAEAADLWRAPFGETVVLEALRRRWLGRARAVAYLDIADLLVPDRGASVFDRAAAEPDRVVPLVGQEVYPWRLRADEPVSHVDSICTRFNEDRSLSRWCIAPGSPDNGLFWRLVRVGGAKPVTGGAGRFLRAMGVAFPGVAPAKLVSKSDLVESETALQVMQRAFGTEPVRMPAAAPVVSTRVDKRRVTIVTAMKNEGPYIIDWLAHNRAIGINRFLVYTNDCTDGTDRILDLLTDAGVVERRDNPFREMGAVPQHAAFRAAEKEDLVASTDWLMTMDVDEYINIHRGRGHIDDLFDAVPDANLISMPWRLFGNGHVHAFDPAPVTQQFHFCANAFCPKPHQAWGFKTLFRNAGLFRRLSVHRPRGMRPQAVEAINWVNGSGQPLPPDMWQSAWRVGTGSWGYDLVSLNHYAVRSAESFLVKRDRGRVNHTTRDQGLAYWFRMNHNAVEDRSIARTQERSAEERASLMRLPGVQDAHDASIEWHRGRIKALIQVPEHRALYDAITSPRMEKLSTMLGHFGTNVFLAGPHVVPDEIVSKDPADDFFFTVKRQPAD